jgi:hypothetical protein
MAHARLTIALHAAVAALLATACGAPPPAAPPAPLPAPAAAPIVPFGPGAWGTFASTRFELQLPLPDGHAWRLDDHKTPWLSATHPASGSSLVARTWTEDGRVDRHRCEDRARLWRTLPDPSKADAVKDRSIDAPAGFDTFVSVGIVPGKPDQPVSGFALAFGGHAHRCFAWIFTTTATGAEAAALVGERLGTMVDGSLARVVVESKLTPKIREEPDLR